MPGHLIPQYDIYLVWAFSVSIPETPGPSHILGPSGPSFPKGCCRRPHPNPSPDQLGHEHPKQVQGGASEIAPSGRIHLDRRDPGC